MTKSQREKKILRTIKRRKASCIGYILGQKRIKKHVIERKKEGRREVMGRRGRRLKQLLDDLKKKRG
jgi:hypothetical protein